MAIVLTSINLTSVSYIQNETIEIRNGATLTIDATPAIKPGTIQCITSGKLLISNSSPTVPLIFDLYDMNNDLRFEAGGVLEIRGAPMALAAGTGAAQTWDFTSLFGGVIRHMTYVEVEEVAGSGVYMPWPVVHEDPKFNLNCGLLNTFGGATVTDFTAGNTLAGQVLFWHETNRTLRCGDNTNGKAVPNACAVRIPNIFISNRLLTNQTSVFNIVTTGVPTGGTFTIEISRESGTVLGTTAGIAFNAAAAAVDTAIEAITGAGTLTPGSGPLPTLVSGTWTGVYANERLGLRIAANSLTGGTNPQVYIYENNGANLSLIDLAPLGTLDAEWVSFSDKVRLVTDVFKSVRLMAVGLGADSIQLNSSNGAVEIDGLALTRSPFITQVNCQIASVLGDISTKRIVTMSKSFASFSYVTVPNLNTVDRITSVCYGARQSTASRMLQFVTTKAGVNFTNLVAVGASYTFQNLTNNKIVNWQYADGTLATPTALQAVSAANTSNCINVTFANYTDAGPMPPRNYLMGTDAASSGIKLLGGTTNGLNTSAGFSMQCGGMEISNYNYSNVRSNPLIDLPTSYLGNNLIAKKLFATHGSAPPASGLDACQGGQYDMVTSTIASITETFNGVNDFVGGNYTEPSLTPTTGHITFGPFAEGLGLALTGSAYTDALGAFALPVIADTAVVTIPFAMHGITGFQNVAPYIYVDAPGAASNVYIVQNAGGISGGTFTISVYDSAGTLLGTTAALAWNATTTVIDTAVEGIAGVGAGAVVSGSLAAGFVITFPTGQVRIITVDGTALTGGTDPGMASVFGRARLLTGTEMLGAVNVVEFAMRVPGTAWPAYATLTGANLQTAFAALVGYSAGTTGLEMRIKVIAGQSNIYTKYNQISLPTNVDATLWAVGDASFTLQGPNIGDMVRVVRASDLAVLYTFSGAGTKEFTVGSNFNEEIFFRRELPDGTIIMRTLPATQFINFGDNGIVNLFYGAEVQLAQASTLTALDAFIQARLDVVLSTRATQVSADKAVSNAALAAALSA
jgi:hypothetical protein